MNISLPGLSIQYSPFCRFDFWLDQTQKPTLPPLLHSLHLSPLKKLQLLLTLYKLQINLPTWPFRPHARPHPNSNHFMTTTYFTPSPTISSRTRRIFCGTSNKMSRMVLGWMSSHMIMWRNIQKESSRNWKQIKILMKSMLNNRNKWSRMRIGRRISILTLCSQGKRSDRHVLSST